MPFSCSLCAEFSAHAENLKGEPMALRRFSEEEARERHRAGCATIRNAAATGNRHEHHVRSTTRAWTCPPRSWPSAASAWAWCTARRRRRCAVIRCPATARWTGAASCGEARDVVSAEFEAATSH